MTLINIRTIDEEAIRHGMTPRNIRIIDAEAIRHNMARLRGATPKSAKMMAVVKADGYGHGAVIAAKAALAGGAEALAVATAAEGAELMEAGLWGTPVLVLGAAGEADAEMAAACGLTQTVCSPEMVAICEKAAEKHLIGEETTPVHLKIDTGMGRIGVRTEAERDAVLAAIAASPRIRLTGAYTHFSDADGNEDGEAYSEAQFRRFLAMTEGLGVPRHCANSAATLRHPEWALEMVREGISLYGCAPVETGLDLRPCMEWRAKISYIKELPAGEYVSYGRTFRTEKTTRVATITCGYGDGYHRAASGKAEALIHGKRARILGRVCMDQMMADVTEIPEARTEDPVILMGRDGGEKITAEDIARWAGTIPYEVLLSCGSRVTRMEKREWSQRTAEGAFML